MCLIIRYKIPREAQTKFEVRAAVTFSLLKSNLQIKYQLIELDALYRMEFVGNDLDIFRLRYRSCRLDELLSILG